MIATDSTSRVPAVFEGQEIAGRYVLRRVVASGGMAQVWEADDAVLGRRVAVKLLHPHLAGDPDFVARFRQEAKAAARLSHQSIVAIYDTASQEGVEAIVMELIDGMTLRDYLDGYGTLSLADTADLTQQVAAALDAAHAARIVHRDIKPGNILLCPDRRVKVTDFGIAKALEGGDETTPGTLLGTAKYLSPEQVEGTPVDGRADIYSLGVVLYECLTGSPPFVADNDSATALARLRVDPRPLRELDPSIPPGVEQAVLTALARDRDRRYAQAGQLAEAFAGAVVAGTQPGQGTAADPTRTGAAPVAAPAAPSAAAVVPSPAASTTSAPSSPPADHRRRPRRRLVAPLLVVAVVLGSLALGFGLILATTAGRDFINDLRDGLTGDENAGSATTSAASPAETNPDTTDATADGNGAEDDDADRDETATENVSTSSILIAEVIDYDPHGDDSERPERTQYAADGDPTTSWASESYSNRSFGNLKDGVGLVFVLDREATLHTLDVDSPTGGWAAQVFAADAPMGDVPMWGDSLDGRVDIDGGTSFDLRGVRGSAVLLWITDLGDAPPQLRVEITDVALS